MAGSTWPTLVAGARAKASEVEAKFDWVEQDLVPMAAGTKVDATYDLGTSSFRWRDLYTSRQILGPAGSASSPTYSRQSGTNTGIFFPSTVLGAACANGSESFRWGAAQFLALDGSVGTPSVSWANSTAMGFYRIGANNIGGAVSGAKFLDVSSAGEVLMPLQPAFFAYFNTSAVLAITGNGSTSTITVDAELFDNGSDFASSKFTAPITGHYLFNYAINTQFSATIPSALITCSLVTTPRSYHDNFTAGVVTGSSAQITRNVFVFADMTAGSTAHIEFSVSGAGANTCGYNGTAGGGIRTFFAGYLLP